MASVLCRHRPVNVLSIIILLHAPILISGIQVFTSKQLSLGQEQTIQVRNQGPPITSDVIIRDDKKCSIVHSSYNVSLMTGFTLVHFTASLPCKKASIDLIESEGRQLLHSHQLPCSAPSLLLQTDDSVYIPGSPVKSVIFALGTDKKPVAGIEVIVQLKNPDGEIENKSSLHTNMAGSSISTFRLPENATLGGWRIEYYVSGFEKPRHHRSITVQSHRDAHFIAEFSLSGSHYDPADGDMVINVCVRRPGFPKFNGTAKISLHESRKHSAQSDKHKYEVRIVDGYSIFLAKLKTNKSTIPISATLIETQTGFTQRMRTQLQLPRSNLMKSLLPTYYTPGLPLQVQLKVFPPPDEMMISIKYYMSNNQSHDPVLRTNAMLDYKGEAIVYDAIPDYISGDITIKLSLEFWGDTFDTFEVSHTVQEINRSFSLVSSTHASTVGDSLSLGIIHKANSSLNSAYRCVVMNSGGLILSSFEFDQSNFTLNITENMHPRVTISVIALDTDSAQMMDNGIQSVSVRVDRSPTFDAQLVLQDGTSFETKTMFSPGEKFSVNVDIIPASSAIMFVQRKDRLSLANYQPITQQQVDQSELLTAGLQLYTSKNLIMHCNDSQDMTTPTYSKDMVTASPILSTTSSLILPTSQPSETNAKRGEYSTTTTDALHTTTTNAVHATTTASHTSAYVVSTQPDYKLSGTNNGLRMIKETDEKFVKIRYKRAGLYKKRTPKLTSLLYLNDYPIKSVESESTFTDLLADDVVKPESQSNELEEESVITNRMNLGRELSTLDPIPLDTSTGMELNSEYPCSVNSLTSLTQDSILTNLERSCSSTPFQLPDAEVSEWIISAIIVSPVHGMMIIPSVALESKSDLFLRVKDANIDVMEGEHFQIRPAVFSARKTSTKVHLRFKISVVESFCFKNTTLDSYPHVNLTLPAEGAQVASFQATALRRGDHSVLVEFWADDQFIEQLTLTLKVTARREPPDLNSLYSTTDFMHTVTSQASLQAQLRYEKTANHKRCKGFRLTVDRQELPPTEPPQSWVSMYDDGFGDHMRRRRQVIQSKSHTLKICMKLLQQTMAGSFHIDVESFSGYQTTNHTLPSTDHCRQMSVHPYDDGNVVIAENLKPDHWCCVEFIMTNTGGSSSTNKSASVKMSNVEEPGDFCLEFYNLHGGPAYNDHICSEHGCLCTEGRRTCSRVKTSSTGRIAKLFADLLLPSTFAIKTKLLRTLPNTGEITPEFNVEEMEVIDSYKSSNLRPGTILHVYSRDGAKQCKEMTVNDTYMVMGRQPSLMTGQIASLYLDHHASVINMADLCKKAKWKNVEENPSVMPCFINRLLCHHSQPSNSSEAAGESTLPTTRTLTSLVLESCRIQAELDTAGLESPPKLSPPDEQCDYESIEEENRIYKSYKRTLYRSSKKHRHKL